MKTHDFAGAAPTMQPPHLSRLFGDETQSLGSWQCALTTLKQFFSGLPELTLIPKLIRIVTSNTFYNAIICKPNIKKLKEGKLNSLCNILTVKKSEILK